MSTDTTTENPSRIRSKDCKLSFGLQGGLHQVTYEATCLSPLVPCVARTREEHSDSRAQIDALLEHLFSKKRVRHIFIPDLSEMTARFAFPHDFKMTGTLSSGIEVYRTDKKAELIQLLYGDAFYMRTAGCFVIVATGGGYCVAGHLGRDSLVDRGRIMGDEARTCEGVVHNIASFFQRKGIEPSKIVIRVGFGLPQPVAHGFEQVHGAYYQKLVKEIETRWQPHCDRARPIVTYPDGYAHINLYYLVRAIAGSLKITNVGNERPLTQYFASTRHEDPWFVSARNDVTVYRPMPVL